MKNDSCLTVSRRAAIIRQDAEENYGTLLTLGESMRRAYQVEELIDRMRWDNADFCLQRTDGTCLSITGTLTEYEHYFGRPYYENPSNRFLPYYDVHCRKWLTCRVGRDCIRLFCEKKLFHGLNKESCRTYTK